MKHYEILDNGGNQFNGVVVSDNIRKPIYGEDIGKVIFASTRRRTFNQIMKELSTPLSVDAIKEEYFVDGKQSYTNNLNVAKKYSDDIYKYSKNINQGKNLYKDIKGKFYYSDTLNKKTIDYIDKIYTNPLNGKVEYQQFDVVRDEDKYVLVDGKWAELSKGIKKIRAVIHTDDSFAIKAISDVFSSQIKQNFNYFGGYIKFFSQKVKTLLYRGKSGGFTEWNSITNYYDLITMELAKFKQFTVDTIHDTVTKVWYKLTSKQKSAWRYSGYIHKQTRLEVITYLIHSKLTESNLKHQLAA